MTAKALPSSLRDNPIFLTQRAALALAARSRKALKARGIEDINPAQLSILGALEEGDGTTATALSRVVCEGGGSLSHATALAARRLTRRAWIFMVFTFVLLTS